jgi:Cullin family
MFGSDADFIEEYENILAEKLLLSRVADINEEIKNIELLKLRFGEQKMIRSAVILRDVDDSHRFNTNAVENLKRDRSLPQVDGLTPLNSSMLFTSSGYWPINNGVTHFTYPAAYAEVYSKLHEQFKLHKSFMYLEQHNNLGSVELELSFRSGAKQTFKCEPIQAILISQFSTSRNPSSKPIGLEDLAKQIQAQKGFVRGKMFYWVKKGVVREVRKNLAASTPMLSSLQLMKSGSLQQKFLFNRGEAIVDESTQIGEDASYELVLDYVPHEAADQDADLYGVNADEMDNEQLSRETVSSRDMQANLKKFEPKIIAILTVNGPKKLQKLKCLLDTVYKPEGMNMVGMNELAEILAAMVKSRKVSVVNDIYSLYMQ